MANNKVDFNNYEKIELECMKVLTSKPDIYISQYDIYNKVYEKFDIKDPIDKDNFKYKFLIVLRALSTVYPDVSISNKDNILYLSFSMNKEAKNNLAPDLNFKDNQTKVDLPTDISVIQFILDQGLSEFYFQKDYLGNNLLHYLVIHNDLDRLSKHYFRLKNMLFDKNNDGKTAIDLISDVRISNFYISLLIENGRARIKEIEDLRVKYNNLEKQINLIFKRLFFMFFLIFMLKVISFYSNK